MPPLLLFKKYSFSNLSQACKNYAMHKKKIVANNFFFFYIGITLKKYFIYQLRFIFKTCSQVNAIAAARFILRQTLM